MWSETDRGSILTASLDGDEPIAFSFRGTSPHTPAWSDCGIFSSAIRRKALCSRKAKHFRHVLSFSIMNVVLRGLLSTDSESLLRWRNDSETRRNSINTAEVPREEHVRWFAKMLAAHPQRVLIADIDGASAGVVRLDWNDEHDSCYLSFTVAPEHRGKGCGFAIVEQAIRDMQNTRVCAQVKMSNVASRRIFEKLGFRVIDTQGELLMYAKDFGAKLTL
jgi:RimJ/RimL family protein N-acetyltransferase